MAAEAAEAAAAAAAAMVTEAEAAVAAAPAPGVAEAAAEAVVTVATGRQRRALPRWPPRAKVAVEAGLRWSTSRGLRPPRKGDHLAYN